MDKKIWLNEGLVSCNAARIDPLDRGFALGDGLFETMRVRDGEVIRFEEHLARLRNGAGVVGLSLRWTDAELVEAIAQTLSANELKEAFARLTVSRGVPSVRGLLPDKDAQPTLVIQCGAFRGYSETLYQRGIALITSTIRRNELSPLSNIKSLNYLDNILARQEAAEKEGDDALMLNTAGNIACASTANIFFVKGDTLLTPPLSDGALPGTMRAYVVDELASRHGFPVVERSISPEEISEVDDVFLTNVLMGIMPVTNIHKQLVGSGMPGKITKAIQKLLGDD